MLELIYKYKGSKLEVDKLNYTRDRNEYKQEILNTKTGWMEAPLNNVENKTKHAWKIIDTSKKG